MGVVKNIIPAIASTNALVSAACVTEVIKIISGCNIVLKNYMQYTGQNSVNTVTFESERLDNCMVCKIEHSEFTFKKDMKLKDAIEQMKTDKSLVGPSINTKDLETVYAGGALAGMHAGKLEKTLSELQDDQVLDKESKQTWIITDKNIKTKMIAVITLE
jgi:ubiquitin-activating enzyme E1 C